MRAVTPSGGSIELGTLQTGPVIGITDYSRRATDDFGVTTIVERGFARTLSVRLAVPIDAVDQLQRDLAALRAQSVDWIADDAIESLQVEGFFKDFSIDLATPPISYCSLSIEGLTEDAVASATAPHGVAPNGQASTLRLLRPIDVTSANLTTSSVAETDHAEWSVGTSYALGARVIRAASHRIYESLVAGNIGNNPITAADKWLDTGPTNRWAMFDQAVGTVTSAAGSIAVTIAIGSVDAVALLDVVAATVRVRAGGYDRTLAVSGGTVSFLDLDGASGPVIVTISGPGTVSAGTLLVGDLIDLGVTEASPTAGITDFSRKTIDDFGAVTIVQRAWVKRMTAAALIRTDAIDAVASAVAAARARPCLWIGQAAMDTLTIYGFFKDFSIEAGETLSKLSLSIEGLSTAARVRTLEAALGIDDLIAAVAAAQSTADSAAAQIESAADDGVLDRKEKSSILVPRDATLEAVWSYLDAQGAIAGASVASARSTAAAARMAWQVYRNSLSPAWNNDTLDTAIVRATFVGKLNDYDFALDLLADALRQYAGTIASWGGVSGSGRPEDNSTRNDDGANMLFAPHDPAGWGFANGASLANLGTGRPLLANSARLAGGFHQVFWSSGRRIQVTPGDVLWFRHTAGRDSSVTSGTDNVRGGLLRFNSAGTQLADGTDIPGSAISASEITPGQYVTRYGKVTIPEGVAFVQTYSVRIGSSGGSFYVAEPFLNRFEPGATVTSTNVAAAITGQGFLATQDSVDLATRVTGTLPVVNADPGLQNSYITYDGLGGGDVGLQDEIYFGSAYLREVSGGSVASLGAFKTSIGTAAAVAGQGAFATLSSVSYGSSFLTGFGGLAPREDIVYGDGYLKETSGGPTATLANFKTSIGTAAAISGQAATATSSDFSVITGATKPANSATVGSRAGTNLFRSDGTTVMSQAEVRTVEGTASAISGQAPTATSSDFSVITGATKPANNATVGATWGSNLSGRPTWATDTITAGGVPVLQAGYIYRGNGDNTSNIYDFFPSTTGADRTSGATAAAIAGQQWAATNGTQALTDNRFVAAGANGFVNSALTSTLAGWQTVGWYSGGTNATGVIATGGRNLSGYFGRRNVAWVRWQKASGTLSTGEYFFGPSSRGFSGDTAELYRYGLPVKNGDRVYVSGRFAIHGGANAKVRVRLWSETGALITEADGYGTFADARLGGPTGVNGDGYAFVECFFAVPAGCAYATWGCYAFASGGQGDIYLFAADPVMSVIPAGQVAGVPYVPGSPDRAADATVENTAAAIAGQGALATLNAISLATQATGKIPDGRSLSGSNNFGIRALSAVGAITDYVSGGDPYISIAASTFYGDWGGSVTYPAANFGPVSYGDTFYIWRNVTNVDGAGSSYGCTPYASDILGAGKVYLGKITVRSSSGAGGTTGTRAGTVVTGTGGGSSGYNIP